MSKIGNYVVGQVEEVDRLASLWCDAFDITRSNAIFNDIHLEWLAYEAIHGEQE